MVTGGGNQGAYMVGGGGNQGCVRGRRRQGRRRDLLIVRHAHAAFLPLRAEARRVIGFGLRARVRRLIKAPAVPSNPAVGTHRMDGDKYISGMDGDKYSVNPCGTRYILLTIHPPSVKKGSFFL